jgi:hypothetical protein
MSRSGYVDNGDIEQWDLIRWRGAVASAIRGKREQAFLLEMWKAMTTLPEPKLIANSLIDVDGQVCALGSVARARGLDLNWIDPESRAFMGTIFGIPDALAKEIMFMNDDWRTETPEARYVRMKKWIESELRPVETDSI